MQSAIVKTLEQFGDAALPSLHEALHHARWQIREQAAEVIGLIGAESSTAALINALQDVQWWVHFAAVGALDQLDQLAVAEAKPALQSLLNDREQPIRALALKVLERIDRRKPHTVRRA